jgi:hypothetical protein
VVSEEGRGSTFTIVLPRAESSIEANPSTEKPNTSRSNVAEEPRSLDAAVDTKETDVSV